MGGVHIKQTDPRVVALEHHGDSTVSGRLESRSLWIPLNSSYRCVTATLENCALSTVENCAV
jgi:hypothetical protein